MRKKLEALVASWRKQSETYDPSSIGFAQAADELQRILDTHQELQLDVYHDMVCEAAGCNSPAVYQGWVRQRDGFGLLTGLVQARQMCDAHRKLFVGQSDDS